MIANYNQQRAKQRFREARIQFDTANTSLQNQLSAKTDKPIDLFIVRHLSIWYTAFPEPCLCRPIHTTITASGSMIDACLKHPTRCLMFSKAKISSCWRITFNSCEPNLSTFGLRMKLYTILTPTAMNFNCTFIRHAFNVCYRTKFLRALTFHISKGSKHLTSESKKRNRNGSAYFTPNRTSIGHLLR